jgi:phage-related tail fiber protein|nr:phage tail protein [Brucella anthropi]
MAQNTFALMTNLGRAKEAAALANGTSVVITHIAIGDGTTVPSGGETALYHEVARKAISGHGTVVGASNVAYFDIFLEASEGPYTIREAGLIDQDGDLIAIARYDPPISKPIPSSGQTVEGTIRLEIAFSNIAAITVVVDPAFNVTLQRLNRLPWFPILSMTLATPPTTPSVGDVFLVPTGATGAWSGQAGKIAEYTSAGWGVISPPDGHGVSLPDGRIFERVSGNYIEKPALDAQSGKWSYAVASGTANAIVVTLVPVPTSYPKAINVKFIADNTAAATIKINGLNAVQIKRYGGSSIRPGDIIAGGVGALVFNDADNTYQLISMPVSGGGAVAYITPGTYTFTVPPGITQLKRIRLWGAGGGGGGSDTAGTLVGGGGGAGAYGEFSSAVNVVPGSNIAITVGAGGSAGAIGSNGGAGGASSVGSIITTPGGGGGYGNAGALTPPGGVAPSTGDVRLDGERGYNGNPSAPTSGIGGASPFGGGVSVMTAAGNGGPGHLPGGGGGGAGRGVGGLTGGAGGAGMVIIEY